MAVRYRKNCEQCINAPEGFKHCHRMCDEVKPLDDFHNDSKSVDGKSSGCKVCNNLVTNERRLADPHGTYLRAQESRKRNWEYYQNYKKEWDQTHLQMSQDNRLMWKGGFDLDGYADRLFEQGMVCKICKTDKPGTRGGFFFAVDHDRNCCKGAQSCGKCVRGLVCHRCNVYVIPVFEGTRNGNIDAEYESVKAYMEEYAERRAELDALDESLDAQTIEESSFK